MELVEIMDRNELSSSGRKILSAFAIPENKERADRYVNDIRSSLIETSKKFNRYCLLLIMSLVTYHLAVFHGTPEVSFFNVKIKSVSMIQKWFLIVPSSIFCLSCCIGYLRVYQQESIEWILAAFRQKEFKSDLFRLTFPSSHILALDMLRREHSIFAKVVAKLTSILFAAVSITMPIGYIIWAYAQAFDKFGIAPELIVSSIISTNV